MAKLLLNPYPTFSYWCIKVNECESIQDLQNICLLFVDYKYKYPLIEFEYFIEHTDNKLNTITSQIKTDWIYVDIL